MLGLSSLLAETGNELERSVLTDQEMNNAVTEAAALEPSDPRVQQVTERVNRGLKASRVIPTSDLRIRAEYSLRAHMLPENIRQALAAERLKVVNMAFYKIDAFSGKQAELMLNADTKKPGVTNVNNRKLEENNYFLLTSIILQGGTYASDNPATASFGIITKEVRLGEFSLKNGEKILVHPTSCEVFTKNTDGTTKAITGIAGEWKLDNPKFIAPMTEIIAEIKTPVAPTSAVYALKLVLVGAGLVKA
jgi:hypothetical protein